MARPRVFVSSTYYDLKHIRSSLELFIESVGYEPVLSEKGDIAYMPDATLDESCYREAGSADVFVLVVGGRYGSEVSGDRKKLGRAFFERYESITRKEFETAYNSDIPIFILVESGVYSEYHTYLKNRSNRSVRYAHVDSINVFALIDDILSRPRNNPVFSFERSSQIELWLRDQWAGLFRELLKSRSQQRQLLALTGQVAELKAVNDTLKKYLEAVMTGISRDDSSKLIETEEKRLEGAKRGDLVRQNPWFTYMKTILNVDDEDIIRIISASTSAEGFERQLDTVLVPDNPKETLMGSLQDYSDARRDFNTARAILGLHEVNFLREAGLGDEESSEGGERASKKSGVKEKASKLDS